GVRVRGGATRRTPRRTSTAHHLCYHFACRRERAAGRRHPPWASRGGGRAARSLWLPPQGGWSVSSLAVGWTRRRGNWPVLVLLLALLAAGWQPAAPAGAADGGGEPAGSRWPLVVHFFDVGQGDAVLFQGEDFTILIDAGRHDRADV